METSEIMQHSVSMPSMHNTSQRLNVSENIHKKTCSVFSSASLGFARLVRANTRVNTKYTEGDIDSNQEFISNLNLESLKSIKHFNDVLKDKHDFVDNKELLRNYIKVRERTRYEVLEDKLGHRKINAKGAIFNIAASISELSDVIVTSIFFELFIMIVIIANTFTLALDSLYYIPGYFDTIFLIIYTIECTLKILAKGLVIPHDSYLREKWNILDILIVITGWVQSIGIKFNVLRALRILRPLRNISSIRGMKVIFMALINAAKLLVGTLGALMFFILVFAIVGLETMMKGYLYRCMELDTGIYGTDEERCGYSSCPNEMVCVYSLINPNHGFTSFDYIYSAIIIVFECVTLQTWVPLMNIAEKTMGYLTLVYFIPITFLGAFLILNLSLAVIKSAFTKSMEKINAKRNKNKSKEVYSIEYSNEFLPFPETNDAKLSDDAEHEEDIKKIEEIKEFHEVQPEENSFKRNFKMRSMSNIVKYSIIRNTGDSHEEISHVYPDISVPNMEIVIRGGTKRNNSVILSYQKTKGRRRTEIRGAPEDIDSPRNNQNPLSYKKKYSREINLHDQGIGKTIKVRDTTEIQEFTTEPENYSSGYFLSKLKKSIKIRKDLVKKIKKGLDVGEIKILLSENYGISNDSKNDVLPILQGFDAVYQSSKQPVLSTFTYKGCNCDLEDEIEKKWRTDSEEFFDRNKEYGKPIKIFDYLSLSHGPEVAFSMIMGKALERVKCIEIEDEIKSRIEGHWSGFDVLDDDSQSNTYYSNLLANLNSRIWSPGFLGSIEKVQFIAQKIEKSKYFVIPVVILVFSNTILLSIEYYGMPTDMENALNNISNILTIAFTVEIIVKLISLGLKNFCRDSMNYLDVIIVLLSLLEFILNVGSTAVTAFRILRVFRIIRVVRVARIFRYLTFMKNLIFVITQSMSKFIYLALLLVLLNLIYALLGYQIFSGKFHGEIPRSNFENFGWAYLTVFQVLTLSEYAEVLYGVMNSSAGPWSALYIFLWIVVGNFVVLNLFIAILLDSFMVEVDDTGSQSILLESSSNLSTARTNLFSNDINHIRRKEVEKMKILEAINRDNETEHEEYNEKPLFYDVYCEKSYFFFTKSNLFRRICYKIDSSYFFNILIILFICLNCITIVWETYAVDDSTEYSQTKILRYSKDIFSFIYLVEFIIKSVSVGLIKDKNSYFDSKWNLLEFIIMIASVLDTLVYYLGGTTATIFKIILATRPLRLISKNESMKNLLSSLISSIGAIFNVIIILFVVWFMFAILGVSVFSGKMYTCSNPALETEVDCLNYGYDWVNAKSNFDNILEAMLSLFICSLLDDWHKIMYDCIDSRDKGLSRVLNYNLSASYYFLFFITIGSFFFLHLFMGVMFLKFHQAKKEIYSVSSLFLTKEQQFWVEMQKLIVKSSPHKDIIKEPETPFRHFIYTLVCNTVFEGFILGCIILNMISIGMNYNESPYTYTVVLDIINIVFVGIFTIEATLKLIAYGFNYFKSKWNIFDFVVVIAGLIDITLDSQSSSPLRLLRTGPQIVRVFRIFRVSRLFRIFKFLKTLQNLMLIINHTLPAILTVMCMLLMFIFIYSVIGVLLFSDLSTGEVIDEYNNFKNFFSAFLVLLRISTGGNWPLFLYDCNEHSGKLICSLYFTSYMSLSILVILNLFIMVVIQNYEDFESNPSSCLHKFTKHARKFNKVWEKYSKFSHGIEINYKNLMDFMYDLGPQIGFEETINFDTGIHILSKMAFIINQNGNIRYNELLYGVLKRIYGMSVENNNRVAFILMQKEENKALTRLKSLKNKFDWKIFKKSNPNENNNSYKRKNSRSLLVDLMYVRRVFKGWKKVTARLKNGDIDKSLD